MQPWKDSRTVKILVGATAIVVVAWWFITGDLPFLSKLAFSKPDPESTQSVDLWSVVGPMLVQACFIVGSALVGLLSGVWSMILGKLAPNPAAASAEPVVADIRAAALGLCKGAEDNDPEGMELNRVLIRTPKVIRLHAEAISRGDLETADTLYEELRILLRPETATATSSRAATRKAVK